MTTFGAIHMDQSVGTPDYGTVVTSDASPTNRSGCAVTLGTDQTAHYDLVVVARSGANAKTFRRAGTAKNSGGSTSVVGSVVSVIADQGDVTLAATLVTVVASGNDIIPQVTGIALTSITWHAWLSVWLN